jgi:hypothetical protein
VARLFGHLAIKFGRSPEDLATEALCHLLRHRVAAEAFISYLNAQTGQSLSTSLWFSTQEETEDGEGQPDMRGMEEDGSAPLLVESKFWAGLTENQPNGYLQELADTSQGVLLFLVPDPRREYLWPKIQDRATSSFVSTESTTEEQPHVLRLSNGTTLLLRSWKEILDMLASAIQAEGGLRELLEDLHQVQSLCERFSSEGFLPFRGDEIGQNVGKRVRQLTQIVQDVRARLGEGWDSDANMATSRNRYAVTTSLYGIDATLGLLYVWWARDGRSPFWLRLDTQTLRQQNVARKALEPEFHVRSGESRPTSILVPVPLKLRAERDDVLDDLANQLGRIAERLEPVLGDAS